VRGLYISAAQQVAELARNRQKDLDTVKQRAEVLVLGATSETLSRRAVLSPSEWTEYLMDYLGQARTDGLAGVSTGLRDLDTMTLGLSPGLYLLAASTGTGKTALAGQIAPCRRAPRARRVRHLELTDVGPRRASGISEYQYQEGAACDRQAQR